MSAHRVKNRAKAKAKARARATKAATADSGRHRAPVTHEVPTWVTTSALTVGLGAALISGSGLAHADTAAASGSLLFVE